MRTHRESAIRPAAVAGLFYPADPSALRSNVDTLLVNAGVAQAGAFLPKDSNALAVNVAALPGSVNEFDTATPKALIAPHACAGSGANGTSGAYYCDEERHG